MEKSEKRTWDLPAILLLTAALWASALRLWITDWTQHLDQVELLVFFALILGLALGKSIFRPSTIRWIAFFYSFAILTWQLSFIVEGEMLWIYRLGIFFSRLFTTAGIFFNNRPVQDPVLFITSMALLYWFMVIMATYLLVRYRRPWVPLAVAGVSVLIIEYYHPNLSRASFLTALFLLFSLLLIGRVHYLNKRQDWEDHNVALDAETSFDLSRGTVAAGLILVVLAWNFPTLVKAITPGTKEQEWVTVSWQGLRNRLSNAVVSLQSDLSPNPTDFGNVLGLGTGAVQGDDIALLITPQKKVDHTVRFYWRGRTYDSYRSGQWVNTIQDVKDVAADQKPFNYPSFSPRTPVDVSIRNVNAPSQTLYSPGPPISINRASKAQVQVIPVIDESNKKPAQMDVVSLVASPILAAGDEYRVEAYITVPTIKQLQASPANYPDWVKERYLEVPDNLSPRVIQLAKQVTEKLDTPYDKAVAVTNYLRREIKYSTSIPTPPANVDVLDWFLFTHKQGYCEYYASAEVMMLRAVGIPARMAVGYAEGESMEKGAYYVVRNRDSHAWPEVYFDGAGWVPFEPTVSQPEFALPLGNDQVVASGDTTNLPADRNLPKEDDFMDPNERGSQTGMDNQPAAVPGFPTQWVALSASLLLLVLFFVYRYTQVRAGRWRPLPVALVTLLGRGGLQSPLWLRRWARFEELTPLERIFSGIPYMLRALGSQTNPSQTPNEQIHALVELIPAASQPAGVVLEQYQRSIYSPHAPDVQSARQASSTLWRQVIRTWLNRHLGFKIEVT